jgi:hypothetical protein
MGFRGQFARQSEPLRSARRMAAACKRHYTGERPFIGCGRPLLSLAHSGQMTLPSLSLGQTTCRLTTSLVSLFCSASASHRRHLAEQAARLGQHPSPMSLPDRFRCQEERNINQKLHFPLPNADARDRPPATPVGSRPAVSLRPWK